MSNRNRAELVAQEDARAAAEHAARDLVAREGSRLAAKLAVRDLAEQAHARAAAELEVKRSIARRKEIDKRK